MALGPTYYPSYIPAPGNYVRHNVQHAQRNEQQQRSETRQSPNNEQAHSSPGSNSSRTNVPHSILRTGVETNTAGHIAAGSEHRYYHNTLGYMYRPRPIPATSANTIHNASPPQRDTYDDRTSLPGTSSSGKYLALRHLLCSCPTSDPFPTILSPQLAASMPDRRRH